MDRFQRLRERMDLKDQPEQRLQAGRHWDTKPSIQRVPRCLWLLRALQGTPRRLPQWALQRLLGRCPVPSSAVLFRGPSRSRTSATLSRGATGTHRPVQKACRKPQLRRLVQRAPNHLLSLQGLQRVPRRLLSRAPQACQRAPLLRPQQVA
ncbi:hypothetical protein SKAU_G00011270 [Synaphobranchus kaupii]|uniref:Uncharacterized protein n=1 Tax=Synaphobranchus kaupii TaxID=118154 RepID=A0A9Q1GB96_SYNKA|nr:hypothetical protein SKAU_G00011270 [Synaphobranchus kaupii]